MVGYRRKLCISERAASGILIFFTATDPHAFENHPRCYPLRWGPRRQRQYSVGGRLEGRRCIGRRGTAARLVRIGRMESRPRHRPAAGTFEMFAAGIEQARPRGSSEVDAADLPSRVRMSAGAAVALDVDDLALGIARCRRREERLADAPAAARRTTTIRPPSAI